MRKLLDDTVALLKTGRNVVADAEIEIPYVMGFDDYVINFKSAAPEEYVRGYLDGAIDVAILRHPKFKFGSYPSGITIGPILLHTHHQKFTKEELKARAELKLRDLIKGEPALAKADIKFEVISPVEIHVTYTLWQWRDDAWVGNKLGKAIHGKGGIFDE